MAVEYDFRDPPGTHLELDGLKMLVGRQMGEKHQVWCLLWTYDVGNEPRKRPEGEFCSLHTNALWMDAFIAAYWAKMPDPDKGEGTPDQYARVARDSAGRQVSPYKCTLDPATYERVRNSGHGLWCVTVPPNTVDAVALIPPQDLTSLTEGMLQSR